MLDKKPHLGWQVALLGVHRQDVVGGQGKLVEHGDQLAALQLLLDLPGRAPAQAQTFAHPAVQQLTVVAVQVALHAHRDGFAVLQKVPAALLPAQSEVELTLSIDASRRASLSIYIPTLDETIDLQFESSTQKSEDLTDLLGEVEQAREFAEKLESGEKSADVSEFKNELNEVERLLNNRGNDVDVKVLARQKLQKTFIALDKIESTNKWPELEAELDSAMEYLLVNDQRYGNEKSQQLVSDYQKRVRHAKSEKNYNAGKQLLDEIRAFSFALIGQDIGLWMSWIKDYDQDFETTEWTDKREARRVLNDAKTMIATNPSKSKVEEAVRTLWSLMPKEKREAAQRASDDILRQ